VGIGKNTLNGVDVKADLTLLTLTNFESI